jgi:HD-GYP domain-containing protein (c-di-GMP phosphodiesterase class II)
MSASLRVFEYKPAAPAALPIASITEQPADRVRLSHVLAALSHALDLTEGQPVGHTVRSTLIGMRIAATIGLDERERSALYYALLLKDAGCSSNAARMSSLFGSDDRLVKRRMKLVDWHDRVRLAFATARSVGVGSTFSERLRRFLDIAGAPGLTREIIQVRCERGGDIALRLGFPHATANAIRSLDEHWNGLGFPQSLSSHAIPLLSRIANLAQTVEVFHHEHGVGAAMRMVRQRRGTWFDPQLADIVLAWDRDNGWWEQVVGLNGGDPLPQLAPPSCERWVEGRALDEVAHAFAEIIDAKSPFTFRHSENVAMFASGIAREMGLGVAEERRLTRAGLLHDIGKVGISNQILDKNGPLTSDERAEVEQHPQYTWQILSHIEAFSGFAWTAAVHHEKLDGSGYPFRLAATELDTAARIMVVADIYEALTATRPYRPGMSSDEAFALLDRDRDTRVCGAAIDALRGYVAENEVPTEL